MKIEQAKSVIQTGGVIAYPTEAVYGLGCDPDNEAAVQQILQLKQRDVAQGVIVIAANWEQVADWVDAVPEERLQAVQASWPGPNTWLFPKSARVPAWISGAHDTVALRVTAHPIAHELCQHGGPLVSTSANPHGQAPARSAVEVDQYFGDGIAGIVAGELGGLSAPTAIRYALTGAVVRAG